MPSTRTVTTSTTALPNVSEDSTSVFPNPDLDALLNAPRASPPSRRILMLYGSLRERSYFRGWRTGKRPRGSCDRLGAEGVRIFDPAGLPLPDSVPADHPQGRRTAATYRSGRKARFWCSSGAARPR